MWQSIGNHSGDLYSVWGIEETSGRFQTIYECEENVDVPDGK